VSLDSEGRVTAVEQDAGVEQPVSESRLTEGRLSFKSTGEDGEITQYEMKLTGGGRAELRILGAPPGMKPFVLRRMATVP
jgi:hypothetical protein